MDLFIKQQGQGPPLVLLHGWGFNGDIWSPVTEQLARTWHVYQVDLPGYGRSPLCEYTLPVLLKQLATHLPPQAVWIGWSLGGLLAIAMARWQPAWVRAVVLVATSPRFVVAEDWPHAITSRVLQKFAEQLEHDTMGTLQRFLALQVKGGDQSYQQLRTLKALLKSTHLPQLAALQGSLKLLQHTDLRVELAHIQIPALLCLGGRDTLVPASVGEDCQRWWVPLRQVCIKPAAHIPFLSHYEIFMQHLDNFFADENLLSMLSSNDLETVF